MRSAVVVSLVFFVSLFSFPAQAETWYLGVNGGGMSSTLAGMGTAKNLGLTGGFEFLSGQGGSLSWEAEVTRTFSKGNIDFFGQWKLDTAGIFLAYRMPTVLYLKGKLGIEYAKLTIDSYSRQTDSDTGLSVGIGLGVKASKRFRVEWEITHKSTIETWTDDGSLYYNSLALLYRF